MTADPYDRYPLTVIRTRYGGSYEGGKWAAFPVDYDEIPRHATGDDTSCAMFWESPTSRFIGVGATVDAAVRDLHGRIGAMSDRDEFRVVWPAFADWRARD